MRLNQITQPFSKCNTLMLLVQGIQRNKLLSDVLYTVLIITDRWVDVKGLLFRFKVYLAFLECVLYQFWGKLVAFLELLDCLYYLLVLEGLG